MEPTSRHRGSLRDLLARQEPEKGIPALPGLTRLAGSSKAEPTSGRKLGWVKWAGRSGREDPAELQHMEGERHGAGGEGRYADWRGLLTVSGSDEAYAAGREARDWQFGYS